MKLNIANKYRPETFINGQDIYIGRGSPLGNPFPIGAKYGSRDTVIEMYKEYLSQEVNKDNKIILKELDKISNTLDICDVNLVCFCKPKRCHGDIIKEIVMKNKIKTNTSKVELCDYYTRELVINNPNKLYLFGDNTEDRLNGYIPRYTQAIIRTLPNALGIDTKHNRGTAVDSYLSDDDLDEYIIYLDELFKTIKSDIIVVPSQGIGTGKAMLREKSPKCYNELARRLNSLVGDGNYMPLVPKKLKAFKDLPNYKMGQKSFIYAGIGSRKTPISVQVEMNEISYELEKLGFTLRSGNALGADKAFEGKPQLWEKAGDTVIKWSNYPFKINKKEIFTVKDVDEEARGIAKEIHPNSNISGYVLDLHARNVYQIFGRDLDKPVDFVLCWTPDGCETHQDRKYGTGGTGQAISYASLKGIPIINMNSDGWEDRLVELVNKIIKG